MRLGQCGRERLTWLRVGFTPSVSAVRTAGGLCVFVGVCLWFTLTSLGRAAEGSGFHFQLS